MEEIAATKRGLMASDTSVERLVQAIGRLLEREGQLLEEHSRNLQDHEKRIRVIERVVGYGAGAAGLFAWLMHSGIRI